MTIATMSGTVATTNPEQAESAQVYAKWINAHGGIVGHPLKVDVCDDTGTVSGATMCAQEAASDHVVAVVGSSSTSAQEVIPVLQQAGIAWLPSNTSADAAEYTSPISFPPFSGQAQVLGTIGLAYKNNCKKVALLIIGGEAPYVPLFQATARQYGQTLTHTVTVPSGAADYSPQVAQALEGGTDCVVSALAAAQYASLIPAWAQVGTKAVIYAPGGQLSPTSTPKGMDNVVNGSFNVTAIPDISAPSLNNYRAALKTYGAPTSYNYDSVTGVGDWISYVLFTNIVKAMQGPITNQTFLSAASGAAAVSSDGILPVIDFSKPWTSGPNSQLRSFNCGVTAENLENGKYVAADNGDWFNANGLLAGTGKLGPAQPATSSALSCQP